MKKELLFVFVLICLSVPVFAQELPTFEKSILVPEQYSRCLALHDFNNDGENDIIYWTKPSNLGVLLTENFEYIKIDIDSLTSYSSPVDINLEFPDACVVG